MRRMRWDGEDGVGGEGKDGIGRIRWDGKDEMGWEG